MSLAAIGLLTVDPFPSPTGAGLPSPADVPAVTGIVQQTAETFKQSIWGLVERAWPELLPLLLLVVIAAVATWWLDPQRKAPKQLRLF